MNRDTFAAHHRERKARCFERTIAMIGARLDPSPDAMLDFVSGLSDEQWAQVAAIANETHDCGVTHDAPSADTQAEVVDLFTRRAIQADKMADALVGELARRAARIGRHMQVVK